MPHLPGIGGFGGQMEPQVEPKGADCVLLLHFDGADGSTTFTDSSGTGKTTVLNGGMQVDTAQSKFGGSSARSSASGDYFRFAQEADFSYPGQFTIDFWFRLASLVTGGAWRNLYDSRGSGTSGLIANRLVLYVNHSGSINRIGGALEATDNYGTTALAINTWYHFACTRDAANTTRLFLNGNLEASRVSDTSSYANSTSRPLMLNDAGTPTTNFFPGWVDEYHIQKGTARWTANFTPPTVPYG